MMHSRAANLGTETAFSVLARAAELSAEGRDIINLGIGQPDFSTPLHIVEAGIKALRDGHHGYTRQKGFCPCVKRSGKAFIDYNVDVNPDHVQILPGGKWSCFLLLSFWAKLVLKSYILTPAFPSIALHPFGLVGQPCSLFFVRR